ncbi:MAG: hypothetical protein ABUL72_06400, partial [Armatimonadota bacterium]
VRFRRSAATVLALLPQSEFLAFANRLHRRRAPAKVKQLKGKKAFPLIELPVVIAIIAIAILFPGFAQEKEAAKTFW